MYIVKHYSDYGYKTISQTYGSIEDAMEGIKQSIGYELAKMHGHYSKTTIEEEDGTIIFEANY